MSVVEEIAAERQRQAERHGYTADHDDAHDGGEIAMAAACYATPNLIYVEDRFAGGVQFIDPWPWEMDSDARGVKEGEHAGANYPPPPHAYPPAQRRRLLIKAAALLVAEVERLDRAGAREAEPFDFRPLHERQATRGLRPAGGAEKRKELGG